MFFTTKWNEIMGPKDERLEAEENKAMKVSSTILFIGSALCLYYILMLNQVATTTEHRIFTPTGENGLLAAQFILIITIIAASITSITMQAKSGFISSRKRFAEIDHIPWDFVLLLSLFCGVIVGALASGMRIIAEIQIVGIDQVAWFGDLALGAVFFIMAFLIAFAATTYFVYSTIKRRRELDALLED